ncbi:hypothetical protein FS749_004102 [Ceratobasidium sp. UAMH 11750]|nr:hypothetical protein FS749_004102 [Ceratobasidium sp. UAMH 11750]
MSNLRTAATQQSLSAHQHSASSSNLHAAFKAKGAQNSHGTNPYAQGAFGSSGPNYNANIPRGRSTMPNPKQGGFASYANGTSAATFGASTPNTTSTSTSEYPSFTAPSRPSFHTFRTPGQTLSTAPRDDDPDSQLLSILSFHMPALEEIRIVRSTVRGSALVQFVEARNGAPDGYDHAHDGDNDYEDTDSGTGSDSEGDLKRSMAADRKKTRPVRAGPGTPILSLELLECPYVTAEHVRVLRESVDDVRWKPYTLPGGV